MLCYKIVFGLIHAKSSDFFQCNNSANTRGHAYRLYRSQYTNSVRTNFFAKRIVNVWNSLPVIVDFNSLAPSRGLSNVQICLHSCCVIVLDVFFIAFMFCYIVYSCNVSTVVCHITVFMGTCQCKNSCLGAPALCAKYTETEITALLLLFNGQFSGDNTRQSKKFIKRTWG